MTLWQVVLACSFVASGCIVGLVADRLIAWRLRRADLLLRWPPNRIILSAFRVVVLVWMVLLGLRVALLTLVLRPRFAEIAENVLLAIFLLSATVAVSRIIVGFVTYYARRSDGAAASTSIFANIARITVFSIGGLIILQSAGISITPALAALGVGGLAVALALQDTLSNIFAGLHIIASNQVNPGNYVTLSSTESGYVTDINWRNTTIRSLSNNMVIVPNARLASSIVTNHGQPEPEMSVLMEAGVSYDSDLPHVERTTIAVARDVQREVLGGVRTFDPFIRYHTFGSCSINFTVILRAEEFADQYLLKHEFVKRLHHRYREEGICIPYPVSTLQVEQPIEWRREPVGAGDGRSSGR